MREGGVESDKTAVKKEPAPNVYCMYVYMFGGHKPVVVDVLVGCQM